MAARGTDTDSPGQLQPWAPRGAPFTIPQARLSSGCAPWRDSSPPAQPTCSWALGPGHLQGRTHWMASDPSAKPQVWTAPEASSRTQNLDPFPRPHLWCLRRGVSWRRKAAQSYSWACSSRWDRTLAGRAESLTFEHVEDEAEDRTPSGWWR